MANQEIRRAAAAAGLRLWQLAERLGYSEGGFSRRLRHELPPEERDQILEIIRTITEEGDA